MQRWNTAISVAAAGTASLLYFNRRYKPVLAQNYPFPQHTQQTTLKTHVLELGGQLIESFKPINNIHAHFCAFHCYHDDRSRQVEAHHYCSHLAEDIMQCIIFDRDDIKQARILGVEYVISADIFAQLPEEEKKDWHPHAYEVKSGQMIAPGVPGYLEDKMMRKLVDTYGKTFHLWQVDRGDPLPYGEPKLMGTFYKPGELKEHLWRQRDARYGYDRNELEKRREDFWHHPVDPKAKA